MGWKLFVNGWKRLVRAEAPAANRTAALAVVWKRLLLLFVLVLAVAAWVVLHGGSMAVVALVFIAGNAGGYLGTHRNLENASEQTIIDLSGSWLGILVPSFVGGMLAIVLYLVFLSGIIAGDLFPGFVADHDRYGGSESGFAVLLNQHAEVYSDYAKLLVWSFIAGFNQKYVVDIIESIKPN